MLKDIQERFEEITGGKLKLEIPTTLDTKAGELIVTLRKMSKGYALFSRLDNPSDRQLLRELGFGEHSLKKNSFTELDIFDFINRDLVILDAVPAAKLLPKYVDSLRGFGYIKVSDIGDENLYFYADGDNSAQYYTKYGSDELKEFFEANTNYSLERYPEVHALDDSSVAVITKKDMFTYEVLIQNEKLSLNLETKDYKISRSDTGFFAIKKDCDEQILTARIKNILKIEDNPVTVGILAKGCHEYIQSVENFNIHEICNTGKSMNSYDGKAYCDFDADDFWSYCKDNSRYDGSFIVLSESGRDRLTTSRGDIMLGRLRTQSIYPLVEAVAPFIEKVMPGVTVFPDRQEVDGYFSKFKEAFAQQKISSLDEAIKDLGLNKNGMKLA